MNPEPLGAVIATFQCDRIINVACLGIINREAGLPSQINPFVITRTWPLMVGQELVDLLDDHIAMRVDNGRALWGLISWVLWHEQCIQAHSTS